jgi:hypothetical protein
MGRAGPGGAALVKHSGPADRLPANAETLPS